MNRRVQRAIGAALLIAGLLGAAVAPVHTAHAFPIGICDGDVNDTGREVPRQLDNDCYEVQP